MMSRRNVLTLDEKRLIIEEVDRNPNVKRVELAKRFGLAVTTLNSIMAHRTSILKTVQDCGVAAKRRKNSRASPFEKVEELLIAWFYQARASNVPINGVIMRERAMEIAKQLGFVSFTASSGWLDRFKNRHGIVYRASAGVGEDKVASSTYHRATDESPEATTSYSEGDNLRGLHGVLNEVPPECSVDKGGVSAYQPVADVSLKETTCYSPDNRLKSPHGLVNKLTAGRIDQVATTAVYNWVTEELPEKIKNYEPCNIFNADETAFFYGLLPDRVAMYQGERCLEGEKSEERLTVLLCCNADGSEKLQPLVIGKSSKERISKIVTTLPCSYEFNSKAWVTVEIFAEYLQQLDLKMGAASRKVLLFVDSSSAHLLENTHFQNVEVVFFPLICSSHLQPFELGISHFFKWNYRKMIASKAEAYLHLNKTTPKLSIVEAMHHLTTAWRKVKSETIKNCFRNAGFFHSESTDCGKQDLPPKVNYDDWIVFQPTGMTFDEFVTFDDHVAPHGLLAVTDILHDEKESDNEAETPTHDQALESLATIRKYLWSIPGTENLLKGTDELEKGLFNIREIEKKLV